MLHRQTPCQTAAAWLECEGRSRVGEGRVGVGVVVQSKGMHEEVGFVKED